MTTTTKVKPNSIVQYRGGGQDGCFWEWNYAYYNKKGEFINIIATGYKGCTTEEQLLEVVDDDFTDIFELDTDGEIERFGKLTPISHLLAVGFKMDELEIEVKLTAVCDVCGATVNVVECSGEGQHGVGGIVSECDEIICNDCHCSGTCAYCGEYCGSEELHEDTGYCKGEYGCHKRHGHK